MLNQFEACADAVTAALEHEADLPGAYRLLGMSLGRLDDPRGAVAALERACREAPEDVGLRASLISAQVDCAIPSAPTGAASPGPLGEVSGAAGWIWGQHLLRERRPMDAGRAFLDAAVRFQSASAPDLLPERLGACYVGQAISYLVAGELDSAQLGYARTIGRAAPPPSVAQFARQVYEIVEAVRELEPAERIPALAPLADLVLQARLRIRFYDQVRPVSMHWENLP